MGNKLLKRLGKGTLTVTNIETGKVILQQECPNMLIYKNDVVRCEFCGNEDCTCSDFDIDPDMGDK